MKRWGVVVACGIAAACGSAPNDDAATADDQEVKERMALFGDDRVGDALKNNLTKVPATFQDFEALFSVGRKCAREDSKEIFVVEESNSRVSGTVVKTTGLLPRAVITGCNTDRANPDSVKKSFELMAALVSNPDSPGAKSGDAMVFTPLEVMALDRRTGTYNFYVFESNGAGKPGTITRLIRDAKTSVTKSFRLAPGGKVQKATEAEKRCFSCHVNGGPIMNEIGQPWTNWVSTRSTLPKGSFTGETLSVVSEAAPISMTHDRSSLANDLEQIMRAGIRVWINGDTPTTGFGLMTLEGSAPGGLPLLLKSSFCQTELNYLSAADIVPLELFVDPQAAIGSGIAAPSPYASEVFPTLLPIRSEHDRRIEMYLLKSGYLTVNTVAALRVVDDEKDIFSDARCKLYDKALANLPTDKAAIDAHVRKVVVDAVKAKQLGTVSAAREAYLLALLDAATAADKLSSARTAYHADLKARFDKAAALLTTASGRTTLKARVTAKKAAAKAMFPDAANPMPILE